jgi:hypothetical protein
MSAIVEAIAMLVTGVFEAFGAAETKDDGSGKRNAIYAIGMMILVLIFVVVGSVVAFLLIWGPAAS